MSFLRRLIPFIPRSPATPRSFPKNGFQQLPRHIAVEEETLPDYLAARYYPAIIGEVLVSRYQLVGKLGFGTTSTVWLAKDLNAHSHVAIKIAIRSTSLGPRSTVELDTCSQISQGPRNHPGRDALRPLLDSFIITGPDGEHQCLVHPPLWENMRTFLTRNPGRRLPSPVLAIVLQRVFEALDYLHNHCHLVHTDIKADNIMFGIEDDKTLCDFEEAEMRSPTPRKELEDRVIYTSRTINQPSKIGLPVLCDLGSIFPGDKPRVEDVQPDQYRSPEMILGIPWSYQIDIWSVACMIWDLFEAKPLFRGRDPEHNTYRGRAHLAELISVLGYPKPDLISRGRHRSKFFTETGEWNAGIELLPPKSLEMLETSLDGEDKELFLQMIRSMLQWAAEDRKTPAELANDPWIMKHLS